MVIFEAAESPGTKKSEITISQKNGHNKGRHPLKKVAYFRALPEWGGGFTDAQIFWPFFYQVKVPKIGTFLLKSHNICKAFGHARKYATFFSGCLP